jgi:hypothetical protein
LANFREHVFHGLGCIRARRRAGMLPVPALASSCVGAGWGCPLFFLALLLSAASPQEVVRHPPHGVRGPA